MVYECNKFGGQSHKRAGQCGECGKWNTLTETVVSVRGNRKQELGNRSTNKLQTLSDIESGKVERRQTGIGELDRVLGGGLVLGEVVLMIGEPGIGKSTLLTQLALQMESVVYVCGEESPGQVKMRVESVGR